MKGYGLTVFRGTDTRTLRLRRVLGTSALSTETGLFYQNHPPPRGRHWSSRHERQSGVHQWTDVGLRALGGNSARSPSRGQATPSMLTKCASMPVPTRTGRAVAGVATSWHVLRAKAPLRSREHARQLAAHRARLTARHRAESHARSTPVRSWLGDRATKVARDIVRASPVSIRCQGPVADGNDSRRPKHNVNGGAIGVQLVTGDISAMARHVTRVEGQS